MAAGPRRSDFSFGQQGSAVATVVALGHWLLRNTAPDSARKDPWRSRIHSWTKSSVRGEVPHKVTQRSVSTEWDLNSLPLSLALPQSPRGQIERLWTPGGVEPWKVPQKVGVPVLVVPRAYCVTLGRSSPDLAPASVKRGSPRLTCSVILERAPRRSLQCPPAMGGPESAQLWSEPAFKSHAGGVPNNLFPAGWRGPAGSGAQALRQGALLHRA